MSPHGKQREAWLFRGALDRDRAMHPEWVERALQEMSERLYSLGVSGPLERIEADGKIWLVPA